MTVFYSADFHFGHRLVTRHRGFGEDTDAHDAEIIEAWDKVQPDDIVYILGDLSVSAPTRALAILSELPGRKRLISGNHDVCHPMHHAATRSFRRYNYLEVFEWISPFGRRQIAGENVLLSHFPYSADHGEVRYSQYRLRDEGLWLLHGHTHSTEIRTSAREIHVGYDAWRRLVAEHELAAIIEEGS